MGVAKSLTHHISLLELYKDKEITIKARLRSETKNNEKRTVIELFDYHNNQCLKQLPISDRPINKQSLTPSSDPEWTNQTMFT